MPTMRRLRVLILSLCALALSASLAHACPNCKNGHVDSDDPLASERLRDGYFWSYIAMTSMPFLAVSGITGLLFYSNRKQRLATADIVVATPEGTEKS